MKTRGRWPGSLTMRRGLWRAEARTWNADLPDAQLRILRGGPTFLRACTDHLLRWGAPSVLSPPLQPAARPMWGEVGYHPFLTLHLWQHDLGGAVPPPQPPVQSAGPDDRDDLIRIDRAAFERFWRLDRSGLREALDATPLSHIMVVRDGSGTAVGYAVVGAAGRYTYLQRVAVLPESQGGGVGRALVRASLRWAGTRGARALLLNTQPDNRRAASLYASEGFRRLSDRLELMRVVA